HYQNGLYEPAPRDVLWLATAMAPGGGGAMVVADVRLGIVLVREHRLQTVVSAQDLPRSPVTAVAQTADGDVWIGTRDAGLVHVRPGHVAQVTDGLPDQKINCLVPDGAYRILIGTDGGVARWDGQRVARVDLPAQFERVPVRAMIRDRDANLWIGTPETL